MFEKKYRTDFLFASSTMLIGAGSIFNIAGNYFVFNESDTDEDADSRALEADWELVGQDIKTVMSENSIAAFSIY